MKQDFSKIFKWFYENFIFLNPDKCYFLILGFQDVQWNFHVFATDVPRNNCMLNSVVYRANELWETWPFDLKNSCSLELFKKGLTNWRCTRCPCQICSRFIANVGYIQYSLYSFSSNFISFFFFCFTTRLYIFDVKCYYCIIT